MMLVLSLLIVATLVLSFYSVAEVTETITQALSGVGAVYALVLLLVLLLAWVLWKKRRAAARAQQGAAPDSHH